MPRLRRSTRQHGNKQRAQVLVLFALGSVALMGMIGLAFDLGNIYINRRVAQTAADTGALAGARAMSQTYPTGTLVGQEVARAACMYGRRNNWVVWTTVTTVEYVDTTGTPIGVTGQVMVDPS